MHRQHRRVAVTAIAALLLVGCTKTSAPATSAPPAATVIPFRLTDQNNIVVVAVLNDTDKLNLMLHTAASDVSLTEDAVRKSKGIKFSDKKQMKSWGGESDARFSKGNQVQIGELRRGNIDIWENKNSGKDTDGKFGLDFFENRIVEIDFDHLRIGLHEGLPQKAGNYDRLKIENQDGQLLIPGTCMIEGKAYPHKFLLHTGYSGGILLDDEFSTKAEVDGKIKITEESSLKDSFGHTIKVKKGILPELVLGRAKISNVPAGYFSGGAGAQKMSVIGCEILWRFNIIFDIGKNDLYLSPRQA